MKEGGGMEEEIYFLLTEWKVLKCRRNDRIRKSAFGNCDTKNWFIQDSPTDAKTSWSRFDEKQNMHTASKYLPIRYLVITKGKILTRDQR